MIFEIPGRETIDIKNIVLDFNGTIAIDGKLIAGVSSLINDLSGQLNFHVLTADTFGSVENELSGVNCKLAIISKLNQDKSKLDYLVNLGKANTICVGNGKNDNLMLKEAILGIAIIQNEGVSVDTLLAADIACNSILDVFAFFTSPNRLIATLRT